MPRRTKASEDFIIRRLKTIYDGQRRRAKKYHQELPFTFEEFKAYLYPLKPCPYCGKIPAPREFQVDHRFAVSRGGSFALENNQITCGSDNRRKGCLSDIRYRSLLNFISQWDEADRRDLLMRLAAGGAWASRRGFYTVS